MVSPPERSRAEQPRGRHEQEQEQELAEGGGPHPWLIGRGAPVANRSTAVGAVHTSEKVPRR